MMESILNEILLKDCICISIINLILNENVLLILLCVFFVLNGRLVVKFYSKVVDSIVKVIKKLLLIK